MKCGIRYQWVDARFGIRRVLSFIKMFFEFEFESKRSIRFKLGPDNFVVWKRRTTKTFQILWLFVADEFRGQRVATRLLFFSFLVLLNWYPQMKKVFVDDMSDKSSSLRHNVYRQFGFKDVAFGLGPEKVLSVNSLFRRYYLPKVFTKISKQH